MGIREIGNDQNQFIAIGRYRIVVILRKKVYFSHKHCTSRVHTRAHRGSKVSEFDYTVNFFFFFNIQYHNNRITSDTE